MQRVGNLLNKMSNAEKLLLLITAIMYITITFTSIAYKYSDNYLQHVLVDGQQRVVKRHHRTHNRSSLGKRQKHKVVAHELSYYNLPSTFDQTCQISENPNFASYKQNENLTKFYNVTLPDRTILGQPKNLPHKIVLWRISNFKQKLFKKITKNVCFLMNSINIVTDKTIKGIKNHLQTQSFYKVILATDANDLKGNQLILQEIGDYVRQYEKVEIDSDYKFINNYLVGCERLAYGFGNFLYDQLMAQNILQQAAGMQPLTLTYSSVCLFKNSKKNLKNLEQTDLQTLKVEQFYQYLYIFDPKLLEIVTPFNFAYYSKYTFDEILLFPVLAVCQHPTKMRPTVKLMHSFSVKYAHMKQSILKAPQKQDNSFCFVSYPNDPYKPVRADITNYIAAISGLETKNYNVTLVLSVPYHFKQPNAIYPIAEDLLKLKATHKQFRIRLRIRFNKTVSSLAVYEATYSYCPSKSIIISSRHNIVKFSQYFLKSLTQAISEKHHYYFVNVKDQKGKITNFQKMPQFGKYRTTRTSPLFQQKLQHIQIFKSDLMKSNCFWMLKSQEIDFYQTQSCFVTQMMESIKVNFQYINQTLVEIVTRKATQIQKAQIQNVKKFAEFGSLPQKGEIIVPYRYDCLENQVHRRFAPFKMERNIHQIWIGADKISSVRWRLFRTIKEVNSNFKVMLWTNENITQQVVPYTYKLLKRILEHNKQSNISMYAMAADLLRYELCMRFGGLYIDFKFEALKPLDNYLKYEILLLDYDIQDIRYGNPRAGGIGVMGSTKNNYHINLALTQIINEYTVPMRRQVNVISGGFALRRSLNEEQLMNWVGLGYHLLVPLPYEKTANECGGVDKTFDQDQQVVQIIDSHTNDTVKFGIPCKAYPQAYLIIYNVLGGTWVRPKSFVN